MMGDTVIDTAELKKNLNRLGLDRIIFLSLQKEKIASWRKKSKIINEYESVIDLEISLDPMGGWQRSVGKFYEDKRGYGQIEDWRTEELKKLFDRENIISYFMKKEPDFRLSNEDNLAIVKSMVTHIDIIAKAEVGIQNIGSSQYDAELLKEAAEITKKVRFEPYIIGNSDYLFRCDKCLK